MVAASTVCAVPPVIAVSSAIDSGSKVVLRGSPRSSQPARIASGDGNRLEERLENFLVSVDRRSLGLGSIFQLVQDDSCAGKVSVFDGVASQQGMIQSAQAICRDYENGRGEFGGQICKAEVFRYWNFPPAGALNDDPVELGAKGMATFSNPVVVETAIFEVGCYIRCRRSFKPNRIDFIEVSSSRGRCQAFGISAPTTTDRLESAGLKPKLTELPQQQASDVSFSHAGVSSGNEKSFCRQKSLGKGCGRLSFRTDLFLNGAGD